MTSTIMIGGIIFYVVVLIASHYLFPMGAKDELPESKAQNPYWKNQNKTYSPEETEKAFTDAYNNCSRSAKDYNGPK